AGDRLPHRHRDRAAPPCWWRGAVLSRARRARRPAGPARPSAMTTSTSGEPPVAQDVVVGEEAKKKAEEFVEQEEGAVRHFTGRTEVLVAVVAIAMSLYPLYAAYAIIPPHILRATHLGLVPFPLY